MLKRLEQGAVLSPPGKVRIGCLCKILMDVCHSPIFMQVRERLEQGQVPKNKYIITKQLTKNPKDYPDARNQPHVQVALRRQAAGKRDGVMQVCDGASVLHLGARREPPFHARAVGVLLLHEQAWASGSSRRCARSTGALRPSIAYMLDRSWSCGSRRRGSGIACCRCGAPHCLTQ